MNLSKLSIVVASAMLLQACNSEAVHREQRPLLVSTFEVGAPLTDQFRSFNGQVMPAELTPLAFKLAGEIQQVLVADQLGLDTDGEWIVLDLIEMGVV